MICEECHGKGLVWRDSLPVTGVMPGDPLHPPDDYIRSLLVPCRNCNGTGIQHCCDGPVGLSDDIVGG
jgi:hypothetical protein